MEIVSVEIPGCVQYQQFKQGQNFNWKVTKCSQMCKIWGHFCQSLTCMITNEGERQPYLLCICSRLALCVTVLSAGHFQPCKETHTGSLG